MEVMNATKVMHVVVDFHCVQPRHDHEHGRERGRGESEGLGLLPSSLAGLLEGTRPDGAVGSRAAALEQFLETLQELLLVRDSQLRREVEDHGD